MAQLTTKWRTGFRRAERVWIIACVTVTALILIIDALGIADL